MTEPAAKQDWDQRISIRSEESDTAVLPDLPPPLGLHATCGQGHVTLTWSEVDGAVGYLLHRAEHPDGPFDVVDHLSQDVRSVPGSPYLDTTGQVGKTYYYAISSVPEVTIHGKLSKAVPAASRSEITEPVGIYVDCSKEIGQLDRPWRPMIGSERLSQLLSTDQTGGRVIGTELRAALSRMHLDIGVQTVRAHAIFHRDTDVYREVDGEPVYNFDIIDRIYDIVREIGMRPVVEIGFMPEDLASDPSKKVFEYGAFISPPKDYQRWADLVTAFVTHLVHRYGLEEVLTWDFEVWNEANLEVFWSGSKAEWMKLYDVTAAAVKSVDEGLQVGGPSSAAAGWVDDLLAHCRVSGSPVDFVTTHTYGSPPLDVRASLVRHGFENARVLWTEWGVTPTHFNPINDSVFSAVFLIEGMRWAAGFIDALSYWVASDHFEELGRPPRLLHGGFGLQTVGGIAKPRFHALALLAGLGDTVLGGGQGGDGAGSLVKAWPTRHEDGRISILVWNFTLDQGKSEGDPLLDRAVSVEIDNIPDGIHEVRYTELSQAHGNIVAAAAGLDILDWPADEKVWSQLKLDSQPRRWHEQVETEDQCLTVNLTLSNPSAVLIELKP